MLNQNTRQPVDRIIRQVDVAAMLGVSPVTLWRWRNAKEFPEPIQLDKSGRLIGWRLSVIEQWIRERDKRETPPE
jgi:predicted DNA-binding transcriptional regulator AlpA